MTFGDDRDTIYKTDYRDGAGTRKLTNYMAHDGQEVRDRTGRAMSEEELAQFNEKAEGRRNRHIVISPETDAEEFEKEQMDRATRRYVGDLLEDRPTADAVYSVHDDKAEENGKDVHIAMTATDRTDLEMYPDDIQQERKRAHERFEQRRHREREQEIERKRRDIDRRERERQQEMEHDR